MLVCPENPIPHNPVISEELFARAQEVIPGGVNSPVRAYRAVNQTPRFIRAAKGCRIWDADGVERIDLVGSWGPMILGHAHEKVVKAVQEAAIDGLSFGAPTLGEVEMAEMICRQVISVEKVRLVNSGTEAVMTALRLARAYKGRAYIVKMDGCYHGHSDAMLIQAGSGLMTEGIPDSAGVPGAYANLTLRLKYNDIPGLRSLMNEMGSQIAAIIIEPVAANMGVVAPIRGYLEEIRSLTQKAGALLIFDEVITGFRLAAGGAQSFFNVSADLTVFGKIIGGGMPVGAVGGRADIMDLLAPLGPVYQAGTLSGNPLAIAAGKATLKALAEQNDIYQQLEENAAILVASILDAAHMYRIPLTVNRCGSLFSLFFCREAVENDVQAQCSDRLCYAEFFDQMMRRGVYIPPSMFEAWFIGAAHQDFDIRHIIQAIQASFKAISCVKE